MLRVIPALFLLALGACSTQIAPCQARSPGESLDQDPACFADAGTHRCEPRANTICTVAGIGVAGEGAEGEPARDSKFYTPLDVGIGPGDTPYVMDWNNHRIRTIDSQGLAYTVAGSGPGQRDCDPDCPTAPVDQPALEANLHRPTSVAFDSVGRMAIAGWHNSEIFRLDFTTSIVSRIAGTGVRSFSGDDGPALTAGLSLPDSAAYSPVDGSLWFSDQANQRIRRIDFTSDPPTISTVAGNPTAAFAGGPWVQGYSGDNGPALQAQFNCPVGSAALPACGIAFDPQGNLYLADTGNHCVRKLANDAQHTVTTFAGTCGVMGMDGDAGPAVEATLDNPTDVAAGPDGTVYIADPPAHCIRAVDSTGIIRTVAGQCGSRGSSGDGDSPTSALLNHPYGLGVDSYSNLWIADSYNHRIRLVCSTTGGPRCNPSNPSP